MNKTIFRFIIIIYLMSKIYNSAVNQKKKKKANKVWRKRKLVWTITCIQQKL